MLAGVGAEVLVVVVVGCGVDESSSSLFPPMRNSFWLSLPRLETCCCGLRVVVLVVVVKLSCWPAGVVVIALVVG